MEAGREGVAVDSCGKSFFPLTLHIIFPWYLSSFAILMIILACWVLVFSGPNWVLNAPCAS